MNRSQRWTTARVLELTGKATIVKATIVKGGRSGSYETALELAQHGANTTTDLTKTTSDADSRSSSRHRPIPTTKNRRGVIGNVPTS